MCSGKYTRVSIKRGLHFLNMHRGHQISKVWSPELSDAPELPTASWCLWGYIYISLWSAIWSVMEFEEAIVELRLIDL